MGIKAVLFDLDHTLVDTKEDYKFSIFNEVLSYFYKEATADETNYFWLNNDREKILAGKGIKIEEFWNKFYEIDNPVLRASSTYAYPDALKLLESIKGKYYTGIITNAPFNVAKEEAKCLNYEFNAFISVNKGNLKAKPAPDGLLFACELLNILPKEAVFIGDDLTDMQAAEKANMKGILIDRREKGPNDYLLKISNLLDAHKFIK
jgi:HAD superfamily hydrolase (TIGR01549 family)